MVREGVGPEMDLLQLGHLLAPQPSFGLETPEDAGMGGGVFVY